MLAFVLLGQKPFGAAPRYPLEPGGLLHVISHIFCSCIKNIRTLTNVTCTSAPCCLLLSLSLSLSLISASYIPGENSRLGSIGGTI
jgi:hypothetical protein